MEAYNITTPEPTLPGDISKIWAYVNEAVKHVLNQPEIPLSISSYSTLYPVIYNYCTQAVMSARSSGARAGATLIGEDMYKCLSNELAHHLESIAQGAQELSDHSLLAYYVQHWERYTASAKRLNRLFAFLNRHWTKRERDEGRDTVYPVDILTLLLWKDRVLVPIQSNGLSLTNALIPQIPRHRLSTNDSIETTGNLPDDLALAKRVIESMVSLSIDGSTLTLLTLNVYKANFEEPFLSFTEGFYEKEAERELEDGTLANYFKKVEDWLQDEEDLATKYLHSSTSKPLLSICETTLIRRHLDRFYDAFPSLLDAWRTLPSNSQDDDGHTAADLKSIYALLTRLPDAQVSLRERFGEYVESDLRNNVLISGPNGSAPPDVEAFRVKYGNLVTSCFRGDSEFEKALDGAIRVFNEEVTRAEQAS